MIYQKRAFAIFLLFVLRKRRFLFLSYKSGRQNSLSSKSVDNDNDNNDNDNDTDNGSDSDSVMIMMFSNTHFCIFKKDLQCVYIDNKKNIKISTIFKLITWIWAFKFV